MSLQHPVGVPAVLRGGLNDHDATTDKAPMMDVPDDTVLIHVGDEWVTRVYVRVRQDTESTASLHGHRLSTLLKEGLCTVYGQQFVQALLCLL
jgi:hypothetical protein